MNRIVVGSIGVVATLVLASILVPIVNGPFIDNNTSRIDSGKISGENSITKIGSGDTVLSPKNVIDFIRSKLELNLLDLPISIEAVENYIDNLLNITMLLRVSSVPALMVFSLIPVAGNIIAGLIDGWSVSAFLIIGLGELWLYNQTNYLGNLALSFIWFLNCFLSAVIGFSNPFIFSLSSILFTMIFYEGLTQAIETETGETPSNLWINNSRPVSSLF